MANLTAEQRYAKIAELESRVQAGEIDIPELIKLIRTQLYGMTQTQYAKFLNISDKTLRDIEKGNTDPRFSLVNKLVSAGGFKLTAQRRRAIS